MNAKISSLIFILSVVLSSGGCTTYTEMGLFGGVKSLQINENTWEFSSAGNAFSNEAAMSDYMLLRAAEVALDNNFTHFVPFDRLTETREKIVSVAGEVSTSTSCTPPKCVAAAASTGPRYDVYYMPIGKMTATFISIEPTQRPPLDAISAALIYQQLAPKYISKKSLRTIP